MPTVPVITSYSIHYTKLYENTEPVFELQHVSGHGFNDISLKVYPGEILGVAGVVGAGRTELVSTIFGRDKILQGKVLLDGKDT